MRKVFKKAISVLLVAIMVFGAAPLSGFVGLDLPEFVGFKKLADSGGDEFFKGFTIKAEATTSGTCGDNLTWNFDELTGILRISGTGNMDNYEYSTPTPWNNYILNIIEITIDDGVTGIGNNSFSGCSNVINITIPDSVTIIGDHAFSKCSSITSIMIPDSVTYIDNYTFQHCLSLKNVTIPNSVTSIGDQAFYNCISLENVTIPNSVISIGYNAFRDCIALANITISNRVTSIDYGAFCNCVSLESVIIPNSVSNIGKSAFADCTNLLNVTISNNLVCIESSMFSGCANLKNVIIPDSVTNIGSYAFYNCSSLTSAVIPDSVTSIGVYAFWNCTSLSSLTIGNSVTSIDDFAFSDCTSLSNVSIGNSVTKIGYCAFCNCTNLTSVVIPDSVTSIDYSAFCGCTSLSSLTIGNSVTSIGNYAFKDCSALSGVIIPKSVTNIGSSAFCNCTNLTSVIFDKALTSTGFYSFENCISLTTVILGNGVTSIDSSSFSHCRNIKNITIPDSVKNIEDYAFYDCLSLTNVEIPVSVTNIGFNAFMGCENLKTIYYGGSEEEWKKLSNRPSAENIYYNCNTGSDKLTLSKDFYTCYEGESVFVSGDMYAAGGISNITLDWRYDDGVEVLTPASIINSDATNASFSVEVKGLSAGMHSVTVYTSSGKSDSCIINVIKPESELVVSVGGAGEYYFVDGKLLDGELNEVDEISFKVTVENRLKDGSISELTDELKEKLIIKDVKVSSALSDYSGLLIDIEDMNNLQNIGDLQVGEKKEFTLRVYPNNFEYTENEITLNTTASASEQSDVSIVTPIEIKDKLYEPQAIVSFNVFNQNIIYNEKKYDSESIEVSVRVTNRIPSSFSGNAAKLKEFSDCDITVSEIKISSDDSKLLSDAGIRTKELNTVLHAGESTVITGTYHINTKHKMDEKVESETVGFSCNVSTSANSPKASKSVTFVNKDCTVEIEKDKNIIEAAEKAADALLALKKEHKGEAAVALDMNLNLIFSDSEIEQIQDYILTQILLQSLSDKKIVDETLERFREYTDDKIAEDLGIDKKLKEDLEAFLGSFNSNVNVYNKDIDMDIVIETEDYGTVTINIKTSVMKTDLDDSNIADFGGLTYTIKDSDKKLPSGMFKTGTGMIATADVTNFVDAAKKLVTEEISQLYSEVWGKNFDKVVDIVCGKTVNDILALTKYKSAKGLVFAAMVNPVKEFCAKCPVDIFIYDSEGKLCAAVENDIISKTSEKALVSVNGSEKTVLLLDETYSVIFKPTGNNATMDITIKEFANSSSLLRTINFNDVPLVFGEYYSQTITEETLADESNYALTHDISGEKIRPDSVEKILHYHTIGESETVSEAKCNQTSIIKGKCTICFDTVLCSTDIFGECKAGEWIVEIEATANSVGKKIKKCLYCEETLEEEVIPKLSEDTPDDTPTNPSEPVTPPTGEETNVAVVRNPSTTTISYGDAIILHADVTGTLPAGATIKWEASNSNFVMEVSADGTTCKISPNSKGDTTFTVSVVDANGNVISSDEQVMTSKAGFFQKIIAFFKKLFGLTKTIPQIYKGIF